LKGNVFDMAVGVIIGAAFGGLVGSLLKHVMSPIIGLAGNVNFTEMYLPIKKGEKFVEGMKYTDAQSNGSMIGYGAFLTDVINFLILAFVVFLMVKAFNTAKKRFEAEKPAPAPAGPTPEQKLLTEIRDLLAKR
ncbi:MAG TPA: large conductance mechanosensitive channel protein MscL, partial [Phycisphaerales bacterium]|nr:large conductance mechanosensitive channel protein MscL [Phycisphaerales bacterium]